MIGDFKRLRDSFPQSHYYDITTAINVFDFSTTYPSKSLSSVFQTACGLSLDKRMQRSDWERRPLSEDQIMYAATDAFALLLLSRQLA
jgi:ribonuclease D